MKTIIILSLLLSIVASKIEAADYQTISVSRTALFKNNYTNQIYGLRVDSVITGTDTIFYPFATIQEVTPDGCFSPYKASWIGEKVVLKADGTNLLFNRDGDIVALKTKARLNEKWIAFQRTDIFNIEAHVQNIGLENVLGMSDTVKTIIFQAVDQNGNSLNHAINNKRVKISKNFGFVETLNFFLFPDFVVRYPADRLESYALIGLTNPKVGVQNLTWFDIHNFNVDDELHIQEYHVGSDDSKYIHEYNNKLIYRYLERADYVDSIVYQYAHKQSIETKYTDSTTLVIHNDTLKLVILTNPNFDKLPGEPIIDNNTAYSMFMFNDGFYMKIDPDKTKKYTFNGSCLSIIAGEGCLYEKRYIDGLGGPYYFCSNPFTGGSEERNLVYYKKGAIEWGSRLILTGVMEFKNNNQLKVVPNPVTEGNIRFEFDNMNFERIELFNIQGVKIFSTTTTGKTIVEFSSDELNRGIYLYKGIKSNGKTQTGKIMVR